MYKFKFNNAKNINQYEELIKEFLQPSEYEIVGDDNLGKCHDTSLQQIFEYYCGDKEELKRHIYRDLSAATGKKPKWGILTGIRPVKLAGEIYDRGEDPKEVLLDKYILHDSKRKLTVDILEYQRSSIGKPAPKSLSLYVGIPFCPTRCMYCSFTSNQVSYAETEKYMSALQTEISFAGKAAEATRYNIESVYIGGGTPTTLTAGQLDDLLRNIRDSFDLSSSREFTIEAGRPDTITEEKLKVIKNYGINRISINPQTMKENTLQLIGRQHTVKDVYDAFEMAHKIGFDVINTDLIAGLPEEDEEDFAESLNMVLRLGASNITLHTLAVKRASKLKELDKNFNYRDEELREKMLAKAHRTLQDNGFKPYYLYRQKHTSGNTENTGFCKDGKECIYNIRIMEEAQSNLALGAGGISKIYFPAENRLERVANVSNYELYIDRIEEMIDRKKNNFFMIQEEI